MGVNNKKAVVGHCLFPFRLLAPMLKDGTDVHASLGISSNGQCNYTSIEDQECCNQFGFIVHQLIIGCSFVELWL